ncbi:MAG: hypothetical protein IJZ20_00145, partial [Clostridia bacterium]|nr:hypothetical protein [Clostridia bacterium]
MKFFHVYDERTNNGLEKNNLLNEDSGFKIQHVFSQPNDKKFNTIAAVDTPLHSLIKENKIPFYVDRITGGVPYHNYTFDKELIHEYAEILGDWFLGFQLHESASNIGKNTWPLLSRVMGSDGPYDLEELKVKMRRGNTHTYEGEPLYSFGHGTPEYFSKLCRPKTTDEFISQLTDYYKMRMDETCGFVLPCDSYFVMGKLFNELGVHSFMPEAGWQIADMRITTALTRGIANASGKTWGIYYETWLVEDPKNVTMPCYSDNPVNEWWLDVERNPEDMEIFDPQSGSSRLLQKRVYYFSLMSGADYLSEEWGLYCSYIDSNDFELSEYGLIKKDFIEFARKHKHMKAHIPFAVVLPKEYSCVETDSPFSRARYGKVREDYMNIPIFDAQREFVAHVENVLRLIYDSYGKVSGNEGHVLSNSRFGDLFDIIYEDCSEEVFAKYDILIDASPDGDFAKKYGAKYRVLTSENHEKLEQELHNIEKEIMPVTVNGLHWLVSHDEKGRYLSIFNNEGNFRFRPHGDRIDNEA